MKTLALYKFTDLLNGALGDALAKFAGRSVALSLGGGGGARFVWRVGAGGVLQLAHSLIDADCALTFAGGKALVSGEAELLYVVNERLRGVDWAARASEVISRCVPFVSAPAALHFIERGADAFEQCVARNTARPEDFTARAQEISALNERVSRLHRQARQLARAA